MAPDLANNGAMVPALPLNELQAAAEQQAPVALVPLGDPMTLLNGNPSPGKTTLYRLGVDQTPVQNGNGNTTTYCQNLLKIAPARMQQDMQFTMARPSPDAGAANNLFNFLAQRFNFTFSANGLNCAGLLNQPNPITLQQDANGVTIGATITLPGQGTGNGGNGGNGGKGNGDGGNPGNGSTPTPGTGGTPPGNGGTPPGGQGNTPSCVVNGVTVQNCTGTTTINGQTCIFSFDARTQQVTITCP
jgi:hypothetical protein